MDYSRRGSWQRAEAAERRVWGGGTGEGQGQGEQGLGSVLGCAITGNRGDRRGAAEDPGEGLARPMPSAPLPSWCSGGTSSVASWKQPQRALTGRVISGECGGEKIIRFLSLFKFF